MAERCPVLAGDLSVRRVVAAIVCAGALLTFVLFGCREEIGIDVDTNLEPDTYLTGAPPESSTTVYYAHLYWYGNDKDGAIAGYEWAITDSLPGNQDTLSYRFTAKTDSVFIFQVGRAQQVLGHRFYVRAIDNEGAVDPDPAFAFFGSIDLVTPEAQLTRVEAWDPAGEETRAFVSGDTIPAGWNVRFNWTGSDGDSIINPSGDTLSVGHIVQFEHWLSPRQTTPIAGDLGDTSIVYDDLESGRYQFNVRAVDDAGFAGLDPTAVVFVWNYDPVTYFEKGYRPALGDSVPHLFATSAAWEGEREYFLGDTLPLSHEAFGIAPIAVRANVNGYDPDDPQQHGVTDFEYRSGAGRWLNLGSSREIRLTQLTTGAYPLEARCRDWHGRKDGTPARLQFTINRAPRLLDTLDVQGGQPILCFPRLSEPISLETLAGWFFVIHVRTRAWDPDSTTDAFSYAFRASGFLYDDPVEPDAGSICEYDLEIPENWQQPGEYAIWVLITEEDTGERTPRQSERRMPFRIVP
jgi:hypothetical protein